MDSSPKNENCVINHPQVVPNMYEVQQNRWVNYPLKLLKFVFIYDFKY